MQDPINILIVDDEPKNLTVLETVLDDPAYRLIRAESADKALLALVAEEFALLILDIRMPGMTGFELAQIIKERKKTTRVPIIFLTAFYNEDQHVLTGYETGAVDYLHKPVNAPILRSKVAVFAELHRTQRACGLANRTLLAEMTERRRAEEQLRVMNETLEQRVAERTEALRESEEQLRRIFKQSPAGIMQTDAHGNIVVVNDRWCEMLGFSRAELLGSNVADVTDASSLEMTAENVRQLAEGGPYLQIEKSYRRKDGSVLQAQSNVAAVRSPTGEYVGLIAVVMDISDRRRSDEELRRLAGELAETDRRKDEFLATLAHELRNPLAPIRHGLQIMKLAQADAALVEKSRAMMERQVEQMTRLIDDLMDVSRINQGKLHLRTTRIPLADAVWNAVETSRPLIDVQGHELVVDVPPHPIYVDGDLTRLSQVFANLLNNAAKYTNRGGRIRLALERQGSDAVVSVADNGVGIPANFVAHVFDMFAQIDGSLEKSHGGLGIGLNIVKRLVEMHGGSITAESGGKGMGSEFAVRLPVPLSVTDTQADNQTTFEQATPAPRRRILVVDDNVDSANSLGLMLELSGHEIRIVNDGVGGIAVAAQFRPDVVLMDIGMPKVNGYEACRRIRGEPWGHNLVIIALSGWGQENVKRMTQEAGFTSHMTKPVDFAALKEILSRLPTPTE